MPGSRLHSDNHQAPHADRAAASTARRPCSGLLTKLKGPPERMLRHRALCQVLRSKRFRDSTTGSSPQIPWALEPYLVEQ